MQTELKTVTTLVDHVAIAVPAGQMEAQLALYRTMGCTVVHEESVYGMDQVHEVLLRVGESENLIQLLEPLGDDSPVAKQIEKQGGRGGLAHVAFRVEDARAAYKTLQDAGFNMIDKAPRAGSRGTTVFFVHPKTTAETSLGVLYEFVQEGAAEEA
jgi:methylmalonyl-CoA/ethylmalonyl-CoA epimerase